MNNKIIVPIIGSVILLFGIFIVLAQIYKKNVAEKLNSKVQANAEVLVRSHSPTLGPEDAKIQLVEFMDPECESCRETFSSVKKLLEDYPGKIRLIIRYVPFHQNSRLAIKILEASKKQDKFWETLELLFRYQPDWGSHHDPRPDLIWTYLPQVGLDVARIKIEMGNPELDKIIDQDIEDAKKVGVRATPTFIINGRTSEVFGMGHLRETIDKIMKE